MTFEFDSFALSILNEVLSHPSSFSAEENLIRTEELLLNKAPRHMPSKVGAFEESILVGMCLASGWLTDNADLIRTDEFEAKEQLYLLHKATDHIYDSMKRITCKDKRSLEEVICTGFKEGISFGYKIKKMSVCSQMTTEKMLETFNLLKENPALVSKVISSRAPNAITINERADKKTH